MDEYTVIAVKERSAGNESVGSEWVETATFKLDDSIRKILEWSQRVSCASDLLEGVRGGRLMISIDSGRKEGY